MAYNKKEIEKIFNSVIDRIEEGEPVRRILKDKDMPSSKTFYKWIENNGVLKVKLNNILTLKAKTHPRNRSVNARITNKKRFPNSSFYIMNIVNTKLFKLGVSQNIKRRHKDISSSMPFKVIVININYIQNAYDFEQYIHSIYQDKHIKNEWFKLNKKEINQISKEIIKWDDQ